MYIRWREYRLSYGIVSAFPCIFRLLTKEYCFASSPSRIGFFRCGFSYFRLHFPAPYPVPPHFPDDFRRGAWLLRDFPAFPPVCRLLLSPVLRPFSRRRCGILWAHHGYTWWLRYGKNEKEHVPAHKETGIHTPDVQGRKKDQKPIHQKTGVIGFSKDRGNRQPIKRSALSPLYDSADTKRTSHNRFRSTRTRK